jgi:hypothetical protein
VCGEDHGGIPQRAQEPAKIVEIFFARAACADQSDIRSQAIHLALDEIHRSHDQQAVTRDAKQVRQTAPFHKCGFVERSFQSARSRVRPRPVEVAFPQQWGMKAWDDLQREAAPRGHEASDSFQWMMVPITSAAKIQKKPMRLADSNLQIQERPAGGL